MNYTYIDGDNIGLEIERSFMENDEDSLLQINELVKNLISKITKFVVSKGQKVIFAGADGVIYKGDGLDIQDTLNYARSLQARLTFSIGSGPTLRDSYVALRYAKSIGKNVAVNLSDNEFIVLR